MRALSFFGIVLLGCYFAGQRLAAEVDGPIRKLTYDKSADVVDLLSPEAREKLRVRVVPQNEFQSRILIENLTEDPLTVRLPKAVAAVHSVAKPDANPAPRVRTPDPEETKDDAPTGSGQAVVGTFGPMNEDATGFPHQTEEGHAFTIPARRKVMIALHSACAEHGKRPPLSRMTYELKPLEKQVENPTLQKIIQGYDPKTTDAHAFQAVVWHLESGLSWQDLAQKTLKTAGQVEPYFTRSQLIEAQKLLERAKAEEVKE
jgi:hypothetical protein